MEAAGLALAITPLLAGCAKVIKTLYDVHKRYKAAPAMLTTIATECSTFRLALSRLQSLSNGEERDEILDSIGIAVLACEMTLSTLEENTMELSESMDGMGIDDSFQLGAIAKAKIVWKEEEMKDLLQQLQRHQNNLGFLLTVLQSDSTSQIHDLIVSQGTVLGAIFERAQTARNQSRNSSHSSERNSNRFSGVSICGSARSSILFDFDDEVVNARVYRKALSKWIRRNNDGTIPGQSAEVQDQRESSHPILRENEGNARQSPARTESVQMGHLGEDTTPSGFIFPFSPNHDQPNVVSSTKGEEHEDTSRDTSGAYQTHQLPTLSEVEEPETGDRDEDLGHPQEPDRSRDETTESTGARQEVPRVSLAEPMITPRSTAAANKFPREYNLVVTGGGGVDKSGLATQLMWSHFVDDYDPTIEDSYRKLCVIDDQVALLDVLDTAGQEEYSAMRDQYMRTGEGFVLVYSITSRQSFEEVFIIRQQILRIKNKDYFPIIIVGNKCDLEGEREVSKQEGESLARILGCQFIEASSQARINVDVAFYNLVREIRRYEKEMSAMESVLPTNRPGIEHMAISQPKSRRYFPSWLK